MLVCSHKIREQNAGGKKHAMRNHSPWTASGTATFPNHRFIFTPLDDPDTVLATFIVGNYPDNIYVYDPYRVENDDAATLKNLEENLNAQEREHYEHWRKTLSFHEQYRNFTGRSYLANYLRPPPEHYMWRADYFGQQHWVLSNETQFVELPPKDLLQPLSASKLQRRLQPNDPRILPEYRNTTGFMNMTLTVLSVAPRVFQIDNFLSRVEVEHIVELAAGIQLKLSSTGDDVKGEVRKTEDTTRTRTSYNSWVKRQQSPIIDAIYRRAADLLRIDEALFRQRNEDEIPERANKATLAEDLQLVNYKETQGTLF
jgi:hypothetical protein